MAVAVAPTVVTAAPAPSAASLASPTVTVAGVSPMAQPVSGVASYPSRPAPGSAYLPPGPLRRTLLRLALGCTRTGTPAVRLRGDAASGSAATAARGRVRLEFRVAAAVAGPAAAVDADGGAVVAVTPPAEGVHNEWVDLMGDRLSDLDMAVTVVGPGGVRLGAAAVLGVELRDRKGVLQRPGVWRAAAVRSPPPIFPQAAGRCGADARPAHLHLTGGVMSTAPSVACVSCRRIQSA